MPSASSGFLLPLSGGRYRVVVGGEAGLREFIKWWYPQMRKEGLVVDERERPVVRRDRGVLGRGSRRV